MRRGHPTSPPKRHKAAIYTSKNPINFLTTTKHPIRLEGVEKLNEELSIMYNKLSPFKEEKEIRNYLTNKLQRIIKDILPEFTFHIFGSSECALFLPASDIDILLVSAEKDVIPNRTLKLLGQRLAEHDFIDPSSILHVRKARVPILKCRDKLYGIEFDININKDGTIKQNAFIQKILKERPYIRQFCMLLKYFLKSRNLNNSRFGGLCSYAQFIMVLSFFQMHPLVQDSPQIDPLRNLGVLFLDFFQLYGFDYPYEGTTISVLSERYMKQSISNAIISLEDPVDINHDVGDNCQQMHMIKDVFRHAYLIMTAVLKQKIRFNESCLCLWMSEDFSQEKWRKMTLEKYTKMKKNK